MTKLSQYDSALKLCTETLYPSASCWDATKHPEDLPLSGMAEASSQGPLSRYLRNEAGCKAVAAALTADRTGAIRTNSTFPP